MQKSAHHLAHGGSFPIRYRLSPRDRKRLIFHPGSTFAQV